jgi:hypothetical protein
MAIYLTRGDFEQIAAAIGKDVADVVKHEKLFDHAAHWYGLDCGLPRCDPPRPRRTPPSIMRIKLQRIAKSAVRLLKDLEIEKTEDAYGGPGNLELLETMAWAENASPPRADMLSVGIDVAANGHCERAITRQQTGYASPGAARSTNSPLLRVAGSQRRLPPRP